MTTPYTPDSSKLITGLIGLFNMIVTVPLAPILRGWYNH